jgi:hypothetical protein
MDTMVNGLSGYVYNSVDDGGQHSWAVGRVSHSSLPVL